MFSALQDREPVADPNCDRIGEPFQLQFKTTYRKHLQVIDIFPHEGDQVHYKNATIELRTDSMLNNSYYYDRIVVTDKDGNALTYNRRSTKSGKADEPFGYIRIPIATAMTVGDEYTLTIAKEMDDTAGIHLPETIVHKFVAVDAAGAPVVSEGSGAVNSGALVGIS